MQEYGNSKGILHGEDSPTVITASGDKLWFINGNLHRTDGPAMEYANGDVEWWVNGELHREDGPAIDYNNGTYVKYYLRGIEYCFDDWDRFRKLMAFT